MDKTATVRVLTMVARGLDNGMSKEANEPTMSRRELFNLAQVTHRPEYLQNLLTDPTNTTWAQRLWGSPYSFDERMSYILKGGDIKKYMDKPVIYARDAWNIARDVQNGDKKWDLRNIAEDTKNPDYTRKGIYASRNNNIFSQQWHKNNSEKPSDIKDYE